MECIAGGLIGGSWFLHISVPFTVWKYIVPTSQPLAKACTFTWEAIKAVLNLCHWGRKTSTSGALLCMICVCDINVVLLGGIVVGLLSYYIYMYVHEECII